MSNSRLAASAATFSGSPSRSPAAKRRSGIRAADTVHANEQAFQKVLSFNVANIFEVALNQFACLCHHFHAFRSAYDPFTIRIQDEKGKRKIREGMIFF